jgi:monoterpene epsilon-lactone hydrolase
VSSWQARLVSAFIRAVVRRRSWGEGPALVRRARRLLGAPPTVQFLQRLRRPGIRIEPVADAATRGEWVLAQETQNGVLLYVHGGGFVCCSAATHRPITGALAKLTGRRVFSLNYRLAPEHPFPAALGDVVAAYRWLLAQDIPASTIVIAGDSAGGNLTLGGLVRLRDAGLPLPARAACFSPWTDLTGSGASIHRNDGRDAMFRPENMAAFSEVYLAGGASRKDPAASPAFAALGGLPPVLFQVGSTELLLDDSTRVHEAIRRANGESELQVFDDVVHCWQMFDGWVPEARQALKQAAEFLNR